MSVKVVQNLEGGSLENERGRYVHVKVNYKGRAGRIPFYANAGVQYNNRYFIEGSGFSIATGEAGVPFSAGGLSFKAFARFQKGMKKGFDDKAYAGFSVGYGR